MTDGRVVISAELDTKSFDAQIQKLEDDLDTLTQEYEAALKDTEFPKEELIKYRQQIEKTKNKLIELRKKQEDLNQTHVFENIGNSVKKVTKKISKMVLAIFGIRSAFMFVRSAINTIAGDDDQLKTDIDYMKNALAYTLEPVIRKIVEWARELMLLVQKIFYMVTGKNIFENANKSLKGANKQAKELKKTLAGFDEMNILNEQDSGTSGATLPSYDFSQMPEDWNRLKMSIEDVGKALLLVGLGITAIGLLIGALPVVIAGVIITIFGLIMSKWNEIKEWINENIIGWLDRKIEELNKKTFGKFFASFLEETKRMIKQAMTLFDGLFKSVEYIFNGILKIFNGDFKNGIKQIAKGIANILILCLNNVIWGINTILAPYRLLLVGLGKLLGKSWTMDEIRIPQIPYLAKGGIVNQPGRGVMVGGAMAGERGAEGVIPLTDSQQMALLGEAIGKYITINANITNTMNGRVISRELQKINNESNFAYNR